MAAALSRSWSFFSGSQRGQNKSLSEDYQPPGTPSSRVNLQQRFQGDERRGWRTGPLPPIPTPTPTPTSGGESQHTEDSQHRDTAPQQPPQAPPRRHKGRDQENHDSQPSYPQLQKDHVAACGAKSEDSTNPLKTCPTRRPLQKLPSGMAPLWDNLQDNVKQLKPQTSKIFHEGGRKMNRALQGVRTSISSLSQMFRSSTRRRYKLDGGTPTRTPRRTPRRTPGKLYSPFNVSTPPTPYSYKAAKRLQNSAPVRKMHGNENPGLVRTPQRRTQWTQFSSPSQSLQRDTAAMSQGMRELHHISSSLLQNRTTKWGQFR